MKGFFAILGFVFCFMLLSCVSKPQSKSVFEYSSHYVNYIGKEYPIYASVKDGKVGSVWIGVGPNDADYAFIAVSHVSEFVESLQQLRDKYVEWSKIAKDNNVKELYKEFGIVFPPVAVVLSDAGNSLSHHVFDLCFYFMILDNGKIVAAAFVDVSDGGVDEEVYLAFACVEDFDNLIKAISTDEIRSKIQHKKDIENLFK